MPSGYLPRYRQDREYESPLHEYRVAKGLFIRELAEKSSVTQSQISGLANGTISPLYLTQERFGKIKPWVQSIADALDIDVEDLIPRYACKIHQINDLTSDQVLDISHSRIMPDIDGKETTAAFWKFVYMILKAPKTNKYYKTNKFNFLILRLHCMGYGLQEILEKVSTVNTKERVRQKIARTLRQLSHPQRGMDRYIKIKGVL